MALQYQNHHLHTTKISHISTLLENTIATHYLAAKAELEEKIRDKPLENIFYIYSGCISEDVTREISHRFTTGCVKVSPVRGWLSWYIIVKTTLPVNIIHDLPKVNEKHITDI